MQRAIFPGNAAQAITRGPRHHFFGYYDKTPWDESQRLILAMEADFIDRMPGADDELTVGVIDTRDGNAFRALDRTRAWNWQQGTMLQWLPGGGGREIIYNQRDGEGFAGVVRDIDSGATRRLSHAIYAVSPRGDFALGLNFARLARTRPGYGYEGVADPAAGVLLPEDDGIWRIDLASGESRLVLTTARIAGLRDRAEMAGAEHWLNHIQINRDGSRFAVLHRWRRPGASGWLTRLVTANPDGAEPWLLADDESFSHYDWLGAGQILGWANRPGTGHRYQLYDDRTRNSRVIGEGALTCDGHCSFSPDGRWVLTDTYPDASHLRTLLLWRWPDGPRVDIAKLFSPPELAGPLRCDLHPRWSRDGSQVCFDSAHTGERQMWVLDVADAVGG